MTIFEPMRLKETTEQLSSGKKTAYEIVQECLRRINILEPDIKAWVSLDPASALERARELDALPPTQRAALHGIPVGVKDIINVAGMPTECGSELRIGNIAAADSALVRQLKEHGAIILGKTVTTEFAYFQPGATANPWDLDRTPGGSSSGSAAAVACGMIPLAVGTQTAASLIRPASFCGVFGYVTEVGKIPTTGIVGLSDTLDSIGFFTADADGIELLHDLFVPTSPAETTQKPTINVWLPPESYGIDQTMQQAMQLATAVLSKQYKLRQVELVDHITEMVDLHMKIMAFEAARKLEREYQNADQLSTPLKALLEDGWALPRQDYQAALQSRRGLYQYMSKLAAEALFLLPAALGVAPHKATGTGSPILSRPWQLLGWPTLAVPIHGLALPVGVQFACSSANIRHAISAAKIIEQNVF